MATPQVTAKLLDLKRRLDKLSPADRLRLAARLIDVGEYEISAEVAGNVVDELRAVQLLRQK